MCIQPILPCVLTIVQWVHFCMSDLQHRAQLRIRSVPELPRALLGLLFFAFRGGPGPRCPLKFAKMASTLALDAEPAEVAVRGL